MKQHVELEQFNRLSESGRSKLVDWFNGLDADFCPRCGSQTKELDRGPDTYDDDITYTSHLCEVCGVIYHGWFDMWQSEDDDDDRQNQLPPLLSIGQMIDFLDAQNGQSSNIAVLDRWSDKSRWRVAIWNPKQDFYAPELCDSLWTAVKMVLEEHA